MGDGKMMAGVVVLTLCVLVVAAAAADHTVDERARARLDLSSTRSHLTCGIICQELAAVTIYSGPDGTTSLSTDDHEIAFSAYVVDRRIAVTAGSAFQKLEERVGVDNIRICHVHNARPKDGMWRSCGKIRRVVFPFGYGGSGGPNDLVMIKISEGNLGAIRTDPDDISFEPINFQTIGLIYGYGNRKRGEKPEVKFSWSGDSKTGFNPACSITSNRGRYLCVIGDGGLFEYYKPGDEGGLFIYDATGLDDWKVGGIITNDGEYGDIVRVLRFDKPNVETFIRRTVQKMKGRLRE